MNLKTNCSTNENSVSKLHNCALYDSTVIAFDKVQSPCYGSQDKKKYKLSTNIYNGTISPSLNPAKIFQFIFR